MRSIIFDFDGVIVGNREENYQCQRKKYQGLTPEIHLDFFDGNVHDVRAKLLDSGVIKEKSTKHIHTILNEDILEKVPLKREIIKILKKLKKDGYSLHIISSNNEDNIEGFLQKHNCLELFDEILGFKVHSKKVDKFKLLFKKYNLNNKSCLFVTDTLGDILEANQLGIRTIAVDFGIHPKERLAKGKPFRMISSFTEIYDVIKSI